MKSAFIITNQELIQILGSHLKLQGYNTANMSIRCTSTNVVVAGIYPTAANTGSSDYDTSYEEEDYEEEDEDDYEDDSEEEDYFEGLDTDALLEDISKQAHTAAALAEKYSVSTGAVMRAISSLNSQVAAVAPARVDGATVSKYMKTGTDEFALFTAYEEQRVDTQIEKWQGALLGAIPKFWQSMTTRPEIVGALCEAHPEAAEELLQDSRAMFYRMEKFEVLNHAGDRWRMAQTEADRSNMESMCGAVREVLMGEEVGEVSLDTLAEKLPGFVDKDFLSYTLNQSEDFYWPNGLIRLVD